MRITMLDGVGMRRLFNAVCGALESYRVLNQSRTQTETAKRELARLQASEIRDRIAATAELYEHAKQIGQAVRTVAGFFVSLIIEEQQQQQSAKPPN